MTFSLRLLYSLYLSFNMHASRFVLLLSLLAFSCFAQSNSSAPPIPQTTSIQTILQMMQDLKTQMSALEQADRETRTQEAAALDRNFYSLIAFFGGFSVAVISGWVLLTRVWDYLGFEKKRKKVRHDFDIIHSDLVSVQSRIEGVDFKLSTLFGKVDVLDSRVGRLGPVEVKRPSLFARVFPFLAKKPAPVALPPASVSLPLPIPEAAALPPAPSASPPAVSTRQEAPIPPSPSPAPSVDLERQKKLDQIAKMNAARKKKKEAREVLHE